MPKTTRTSSFAVIVFFIAMALVGAAMMPLLSVRLSPSKTLPGMSVNFAMPGNAARVVESEVTGKLEGMLTGVKGVKHLSSSSRDGGGTINIELDRHADIDMTRFEVATVIRQAWDNLPRGVTYPMISMRRPADNRTGPLLIYTLNAHSNPIELQRFCEENVKPVIAAVPGVSAVEIYGARPMQWQLTFDTEHISRLGISIDDIRRSLDRNYGENFIGLGNMPEEEPGQGSRWIRIILRTDGGDNRQLNLGIPVKAVDGRVVTLRDVVKVKHIEGEHDSYFRVNGNNSIYVNVMADESANELTLGKKISRITDEFAATLPPGYSIELIHDASESISGELNKIYVRTALTLAILLLFVAAVTFDWRYVTLVTISIILTLGISVAFYCLMGVEIQLYSLAGITISLNLIIDNLIVMTDHITRHKNLRAFTSVLAASLTTIGALGVVFFLDEATRLNLQDFVAVIIINLAVSLASSLLLVPALADKLSLRRKRHKILPRRMSLRCRHAMVRLYAATITFLGRHKRIVFAVMILAFGFPVFLIPEKIEDDDSEFARRYNGITSSTFYKETFKPIFDIVFGGTVRLFADKVPEGGYFSRDEYEPTLQIHATLPNGATLPQMNSLIANMERYLEGFPQIKKFETYVQSGRRASISVSFHPRHARSSFPYRLKGEIIRKALTLGGGSWSVYGLEDMGFNNEFHERSGSSIIKLTGYNYDDLRRTATQLADTLLSYRRIKEVDIRSEVSYWKDDYSEYYIQFDRRKISEAGIDPHALFQAVAPFFGQRIECVSIDGPHGKEPVVLRSAQSSEFDVWALMNYPVKAGEQEYRLKDLASIDRRQSPQAIVKEKQQYVLFVQYEYIGSYKQAENIQKRIIDKFNASLPLGYKLQKGQRFYMSDDDTGWSKYWLLLLVTVIIFFISAILFNSLRQPLAIICIIPLSYIGIFLAFYIFNFNFDQGGFASFILLSGITVNAAIYIINEYNHIRRIHPGLPQLKIFLLALNRKITPMLLTIISTVLGFIPFVVATSRESFWFPLAVGVTGGLLMSILVILLILPLLMVKKTKRAAPSRRIMQSRPSPSTAV